MEPTIAPFSITTSKLSLSNGKFSMSATAVAIPDKMKSLVDLV